MLNEYLRETEEIKMEILALRRDFHCHPERGNQEFRTAERIEAYLQKLGIPTMRLLDTAVVGILQGGQPGPTVALRADMDALPMTEQTGCAFASVNPGVMHACGHDVHMAAVLGAAALLSRHRQELHGQVRFFFQPDEEDLGGAQRMIAAGCLEDTRAVFGAHVSPELPAGTVGIRYGKFYAASDTFTVTVRGRSAHGATPEQGINALLAAAEMVAALPSMETNAIPGEYVISVGMLNSGTACNIIADNAEFRGIIRSLGAFNRQELKRSFRALIESIAEKYGATADICLRESYGGVTNTEPETAAAERAAVQLLGQSQVVRLEKPTMTTEDFGYFVEACSGCFYHIGAGCPLPLHNPGFLPSEQAVLTAAAVHAAVITEYLEAQGAS